MGALFANRFPDPLRELDRLFGGLLQPPVVPSLDITKDGEVFVGHLDLPGVAPESLQIHVEGHKVTVRGERRSLSQGEGGYLHQERMVSTFARAFTLPQLLDSSAAEASYEDGILTLRLPVVETSLGRAIPVSYQGKELPVKQEAEDSGEKSAVPQPPEEATAVPLPAEVRAHLEAKQVQEPEAAAPEDAAGGEKQEQAEEK